MDVSVLKPKDVDLDSILESIGRVGKYQIIHFLLVVIPVMLGSIHTNNFIFTAQDTEYRCKIPQCEGIDSKYEQPWLEDVMPTQRCYKYNLVNTNTTNPEENISCPANWFNKSHIASCDEYVYKNNNSFIEEMDIPCEFWKRTLIGTLHSIGSLLALPLIGFISDRFGRRFSLIFTAVAEAIFGIARSFSVNYSMFAAMEFIEPLLGSGIHSSTYIIALELLLPSTRVAGGTIINVFFGIGQALLGYIAFLFPYWRTTLLVMYTPALLIISYYWLMEESNRWLLSKHRYQEVLDNLTKMANTNGKKLPEKQMENLYYNVNNAVNLARIDKYEGSVQKSNEVSPLRQVMRSKILLCRMLKCSMWWITCTFCFYGLAINSVSLAGDMYTNFVLGAFIEIPGHFFGYFALSYFGRRKSIFAAFFFGGCCLLAFTLIPDGMVWLSLATFLTGRLCVALSFGAIYLYTSELFPTPFRHSLLAMCSMIGRIGSISAPQTPLLALYSKNLPSYLFAATCLISALLVLTVPETINIRLPETIYEAENIEMLRKKRRSIDELQR